MPGDKEKTVAAAAEPAPKTPEPVYEVFGFKPKENGSIPVKIDGEDVDLAKATQAELKKLYEAKKRFVRIAPAN